MFRRWLPLLLAALATACFSPFRFFEPLFESPAKVANKTRAPVRSDVRLSALWVGHATVLLQIEDKVVLTDPVFTPTVGQFSKRLVEPGMDVEHVPRCDAVLISHMHFDHLSLGSLELIEDRIGMLFLPQGGTAYLTDFTFPSGELRRWQSYEHDGLRVTAVPVEHNGMRYGIDIGWMKTSYTAYVIEYRGVTVYFGGDSGYGPHYVETRKRFPKIDLAILPIAPTEPRWRMAVVHIDPDEAVKAYLDLGARWMMPMHYDTFINSADEPGDAPRKLRHVMARRRLDQRQIAIVGIGRQHVFMTK